MQNTNDRILWIDCLGGLFVGLGMLLIYRQISQWENLPVGVVVAMGIANLVYGCFSLFVTTRKQRKLRHVRALAVANMTWLAVCVLIVVFYWPTISVVGVLLVLGEGIYVASLGCIEWKWQRSYCKI